ncbi:MAG TPA: ATP-dependent helicase, partial [Acidimicrobiales bacterium]|nr:ATP-dependent helicase [Acidimicrobiales bacterium]
HLRPVPAHRAPTADLAPDQLAAVAHGSGPARVIAPAGSGKTRVLTERLRHLVVDRSYEPASVVAVAYNRKARDEMVERTAGVGGRVLTLNALGYDIVAAGLGRRPEVLEQREVRRLLEPLVPTGARRLNTDPLAPYVEALTAVRLGLRSPVEVEDERGDVPGLAEAFPRFRADLERRGAIDFDEQVLLAIELLLRDGPFRRAQQARHRHLLVDEFQDLTPAHVLLLRLLAAPGFDVFGVGDDDQVIYGHAGASPRFLTEFGAFFPGAHQHALEVNYRCPAPVVDAARHLLTRNRVRVPKVIRAARGDDDGGEAFRVHRHLPQAGATELVGVVRGWLAEPGAGIAPADV